jgi:hypothetical protein
VWNERYAVPLTIARIASTQAKPMATFVPIARLAMSDMAPLLVFIDGFSRSG